jgi:hypothetical protein
MYQGPRRVYLAVNRPRARREVRNCVVGQIADVLVRLIGHASTYFVISKRIVEAQPPKTKIIRSSNTNRQTLESK